MDARYSRQLALPGFDDAAQKRLEASRVLVIGAGGLGSAVVPWLAAAGVGTIGIIDDDRVEQSNLHRQLLHGAADVGLPKVTSAAASVATLSPHTRVIALQQRLESSGALELFAGYDLVVDGSDNFPTRYLATDAAVLTGIPLVWGSVSQYGGQASVSWQTTYRDLFPAPPPPDSVLSCEQGGVLPTTVAVIGSIMATETLKLLTGLGTPLVGRVTIYDALSGRFRELAYQRDPEASPITALIDYETFCGAAAPPASLTPAEPAPAAASAPGMPASLTPAELAAHTGPHTLLDVREPWEADLAALPGSVLVPLGQLAQAQLDPSLPVIVYCHHGVRSERARAALAERGFTVSHLAGGIDAWAREIDPAMARY